MTFQSDANAAYPDGLPVGKADVRGLWGAIDGIVANVGKMFGSRNQAINAGQAAIPLEYNRIMVIEGDFITIRGPGAGDDDLFTTFPNWGEIYFRIGDKSAVDALEKLSDELARRIARVATDAGTASEFFRRNATFYVDESTTGFQGGFTTPVTGLNPPDGSGTFNDTVFTVVGTGADVQRTGAGVVFEGGKYLRADVTKGPYSKSVLLIDFTRDGDPPVNAGTLLSWDLETTETAGFQYTGGANPLNQGRFPGGNAHTFSRDKVSIGDRVTLGMMIDYENGTVTTVDHNGQVSDTTFPIDDGDLDLTRIEIGKNCVATIHSIAVYVAGIGNSIADVEDRWKRMSGLEIKRPNNSLLFYPLEISQSLGVGSNVLPDERARMAGFNDGFSFWPGGLKRADGVNIFIHGPLNTDLDTAIPSTGFEPVDFAGPIPPSVMMNLVLNKRREELGLPAIRTVGMNTGIGGQKAVEFDDDSPVVTGGLGTRIIDNTRYVLEEINRLAGIEGWNLNLPDLTIRQGLADTGLPEGQWTTDMLEAIADWRAMTSAITGANPRLYVWQSPGDADTSKANETWHVIASNWILLAIKTGFSLDPPIISKRPTTRCIRPIEVTWKSPNSMLGAAQRSMQAIRGASSPMFIGRGT